MTPERLKWLKSYPSALRERHTMDRQHIELTAQILDESLSEVESLAETLRDRFAMAALTGLLGKYPDEDVPRFSYEIADKMLDARQGKVAGQDG